MLIRPVVLLMALLVPFGHAFAGDNAPKRIVSTAPSVTEMLYAIGLGDNIVGVTTYCDYPSAAKSKPKIGGMSNPSLEAVVRARPDMVVLTTDGNPKEFVARLRSLKIRAYVFKARMIEEMPMAVRELGAELSAGKRSADLASCIESEIGVFKRIHKPRGKALFIVWPEPLVVAGGGSAVGDAMSRLGLVNVASADEGGAKSSYPKFSLEEAVASAPDYIFIGMSMGDGNNIKELSRPLIKRLKNTPAAKNNRVYFISDNLYRYGPRVFMGMREMLDLMDKDASASINKKGCVIE